MDVLLANPRGFCAGVDRAITIVEEALAQFGAPIYVRHEVVHNRFVVDGLREKGAIFVEDLDEVPSGSTVVFSAHGVSKAVRDEAEARHLRVFDATCPLVTKVHIEVAKMHDHGREIVMIGHAGHPEVEGTMGQVKGRIHLVEDVDDVGRLEVSDPANLAYVTQTTLSVDDARHIVDALKRRFPADRRAQEGRHLLRHAEPAGCGEGDGGRGGRRDRRRESEQLELQSSARGRGPSRHPCVHGRSRRAAAIPRGWKARRASASRPAHRRRRSSCAK